MTAKTALISGAGIAGPTLAYWLKAAGFEPTLVERSPKLRSGGYVIDFWGLGYDIAERMGLLNEINRAGYHIREMRIVNANNERISGFGTNVFRELTGGRYVTIGRSASLITESGRPQAFSPKLERTEDLYFDRVSQIIMPTWSQGRVALVGDAAFCVSLMAGQGAALAMTAAYVLAGELGKAGLRHDKAFHNHERILRPFIEAKQKGAARFASAFAPKTQWGLSLCNQIIKATALPGVARLSFGRDIIDTLQVPDYHWAASTSLRGLERRPARP